jgi:uncharacterized protein YbjT (DUF2867 family)
MTPEASGARSSRVALTGATGFLGARLLALLTAQGLEVSALARRPADADRLARMGALPVLGDLADEGAVRQLTQGAQTTIHCAGLIKARTRAEFFAVNEGGAARIARHSPGRVILISSLVAREPALSDYAASKAAGEAAVRREAPGRAVILRPPALYGPADRETLGLFKLAATSPILPLWGRAEARLALAHVDDAARSVAGVLWAPTPEAPKAIPGHDGQGYGWRDILTTAAQAVGRRARCLRAPEALLRGAGFAADLLRPLSATPPIFGSGKVREMLHGDWSVPPEEAVDGPPARFTLQAGFADAVAGYRALGWL